MYTYIFIYMCIEQLFFFLRGLSKVRSSLEVARTRAIDHDGLSTLEN